MERLLVSTTNPAKLHQIRALSVSRGITILGLQDLGLAIDVTESDISFEANATAKMQTALDQLDEKNLWVAGDDSGVTIDALGGEPGVRTRRWAGYDMTDQEIVDYTLHRLDGTPFQERTAQGVSVVALGRAGMQAQIFKGIVNGIIAEQPANHVEAQPGYPFGRIFYLPDRGQMIGEVEEQPPAFMNQWHRSFSQAIDYIREHGQQQRQT